MFSNIIEVKLEEIEKNLNFCLTLVDRGHTIKIVQEGKPSVLMVPVPEYQKFASIVEDPSPQLPLPANWQPDPVGVRQYVTEELAEMQKELDS
jgi:antitoxin (DNA-binding transcriptional repressor) of toxin-antitoxin stability system